MEPEEIKGERINVTGYPGDKVASQSNTYEMWGMEGESASIDQEKGQINYLIDTAAGQSGSGVWFQEGEDYYVCGIHTTGNKFVNTATLLTRAMYKQIYAWVRQATFKNFFLRLGDTKELKFEHQEINAECISLLTKHNLDDLRILFLTKEKIGNEEAKILARNASWNNLFWLELSDNNIGSEGAKVLARNASWINLSSLHLSGNNIGAEGAKVLAQNTSWIKLSKPLLSDNSIGTEGAKELARNTSWINLSALFLINNNIGAEGAKELAKNTSWTELSSLYLQQSNVDAKGVKVLKQNKTWKKDIEMRI